MTIKVVVADDQPVVRFGFSAMLNAAPDIDVVGTACDGRELLDQVAATHPDVALVDVRMPVLDGIAATRVIATDHPDTRVLILTTFDLDEYVFNALHAGASGFLLKDVTAPRLVEGVRAVADGSMLLGPSVTRRLIADFTARRRSGLSEDLTRPGTPASRALPEEPQLTQAAPGEPTQQTRAAASGNKRTGTQPLAELTAREQEVAFAVARGLSNAEIAAELFIGEQTVKTHVSEALRKTRSRDRVQLTIAVYESGLMS